MSTMVRVFVGALLCLSVFLFTSSFVNVYAGDVPDSMSHDVFRDAEGNPGRIASNFREDQGPVGKDGNTDGGDAEPVNRDDDTADGGTTDGDQGGVNDPAPVNDTDGSGTEDHKLPNEPPINSDQLAGLLVAGIFIAIFLPGFFCLWNIQTPQAFTTLDGSDLSKKNQ